MRPRFVVEQTLGKLGKWLRLLGFDARGESGAPTGPEARAAEDRILLTRTRRRCRQLKGRPFIFIHSNAPFDQLKEVIDSLDLSRKDVRPFSRCLICNTPIEPVNRDAVRHRVPDFVWENHERFHQCRGCGKIYWAGSHTARGLARIAAVFAEAEAQQSSHGSDA